MPKTAIFIVDAPTLIIFTTVITVAIQLNDRADPVALITVFLPCVRCLGWYKLRWIVIGSAIPFRIPEKGSH